jgi:hypothetical protein
MTGSTTTTRRDGDAKHLSVALAALADLRRLDGLDAPAKVMSVNVNVDRPFEGLSQAELVAEYRAALIELGVSASDAERIAATTSDEPIAALPPATTIDAQPSPTRKDVGQGERACSAKTDPPL